MSATTGGGFKNLDVTSIALLAIGAFVLLKWFKAGVGNLTQPLTNAAANAYVAMTNFLNDSGPVVPLGSIYLPNGQFIKVASVQVRPVPNSDPFQAQFTYMGQHYLLVGPSDANGNWAAIKG